MSADKSVASTSGCNKEQCLKPWLEFGWERIRFDKRRMFLPHEEPFPQLRGVTEKAGVAALKVGADFCRKS